MRGAIFIALATIATASADAAESKWSLSLGLGSSEWGFDRARIDDVTRHALGSVGSNAQTPGTTGFDDRDSAWSLGVDYRAWRYLALEAAYVDLGNAAGRYTGHAARFSRSPLGPPPPFFPASATLEVESRGFKIGASGILPLGEHFDLHANLGLFIARTESEWGANWVTPQVQEDSGSEVRDSQEITYGIGAAFRFLDRWSLSLDWQRYADVVVGEEKLDGFNLGWTPSDLKGNVDALTLSLRLTL